GATALLRGNGDGTFQAAEPLLDGLGAAAPLLLDVNGDGRADLVAARDLGVVVSLNDGAGSFGPATPVSVGFRVVALAAADVNRDGRPDLIVSEFIGNVSLRLGNGDGTFRPQQDVTTGPPVLAVADVNREGRPDLITTDGVLLGNGDGTFQPLLPFPGDGPGS